jgi:hypothetical protein
MIAIDLCGTVNKFFRGELAAPCLLHLILLLASNHRSQSVNLGAESLDQTQ